MKRMRDKRFARACFTFDQHMTVGLAQIKDVFFQAFHRGRLADQFLDNRRSIRQFTPQCAVIQRQTPRGRGLFRKFGHPVGVKRLF